MQLIANQDAYLFAFFDAVLDYLQTNSSDIDSFITFWEETLCGKTIPSGEIEAYVSCLYTSQKDWSFTLY